MECSEVLKLLSEYVDNERYKNNDDIYIEVEKHINECHSCKAEYELLKSIVKSCENIEEEDAPKDFHDDLINRLEKENTKANRSIGFLKYSKKYGIAISAAVITIAVSIGVGMLGGNKKAKLDMANIKENAAVSQDKKVSEENATSSDKQMFTSGENPKEKGGLSTAMKDAEKINTAEVNINITKSEYKKYYKDIVEIIREMEVKTQAQQADTYIIEESNIDILIKKLKDNFNIEDVNVSYINLEDKYRELLSEREKLNKEKEDGINIDKKAEVNQKSIEDIEKSIGCAKVKINKK